MDSAGTHVYTDRGVRDATHTCAFKLKIDLLKLRNKNIQPVMMVLAEPAIFFAPHPLLPTVRSGDWRNSLLWGDSCIAQAMQ